MSVTKSPATSFSSISSEAHADQMEWTSADQFLEQCRPSSSHAYEAFKKLLELLERPETRRGARRFLSELSDVLENMNARDTCVDIFHFSLEKLTTDGNDESENTLQLLQLPSIFAPEEWSFTFYEGLARYPVTEFQGRIMTELGCGNGWITIALAKRSAPAKIYGFDINPKAIVCARINLYLNACTRSGEEVFDAEGKSLLDRVEFHASDLLGYALKNKIQFDRIIGCIPQVLNPDPFAAQQIVAENDTDEFLYSLSNYCEKQGYVEDQFGLGLIARALEEAVEVIKPSAKVIMNMGGRPGSAVLERLFTRRGFSVRRVWQTKVAQALDTDIEPLVEIERSTPHRFEFFMGLTSDEPISARTSQVFARAGGEIAHSLTVYEAQLRNPGNVKKILKFLNSHGYEGARGALDLAFQNDAIADEKVSFLASMTEKLNANPSFPYEETEGEAHFRRRLAEYMRSYWRIAVVARNFVVAPTRAAAIQNLFNLYAPRLALVDKEYTRDLPAEWMTVQPGMNLLNSDLPAVIETPRRVDLICKLAETLNPKLIVVALADYENKTPDSFVRLLEMSARIKARLCVDISSFFDMSSAPESNGVLAYLAENALPPHACVICGLVKNQVYSDLEVCFVLSENKGFLQLLTDAAELTYSRTPLLTQNYYDRILFDLLNFQVRNARRDKASSPRPLQDESKLLEQGFDSVHQKCIDAFAHPAFVGNSLPLTSQTLRLDYGENCLPSAGPLREALFEAFVRQNIGHGETNYEGNAARVLEKRFGLNTSFQGSMIASDGVAPLFSAIADHCRKLETTLVFARGSYGHFNAVARFFDTQTMHLETQIEDSFKLTPKTLHDGLKRSQKSFVFLNGPVVNPTGALYTPEELYALISVAHSHGATVVLDTIFSGLEFGLAQEPLRLDDCFVQLRGSRSTDVEPSLILLGGLSKEFAAGGLRFGFAYTRDSNLAQMLRRTNLCPPHATLKYAAKKIYGLLADNSPDVVSELAQQRHVLKLRSELLADVLRAKGWKVLSPEGGLFLVASPEKLYGQMFTYEKDGARHTVNLNSENLVEALFYSTGVLVNSDVWTGIPGFFRFVFSVADDVFHKALLALRQFPS